MLKCLTLAIFACVFISACSALPPLETKPLKTTSDSKTVTSEDPETTRAPSFIWPLKDGVVTQEFREKKNKKHRHPHKGIDIAAPKGDGVYAALDGIVTYTGRGFHGYGRLVIIENEKGDWATFYGHLLKIMTKQGKRVVQGEQIGRVGRTGHATGYHLHFEIRHDKVAVNPLILLP